MRVDPITDEIVYEARTPLRRAGTFFRKIKARALNALGASDPFYWDSTVDEWICAKHGGLAWECDCPRDPDLHF